MKQCLKSTFDNIKAPERLKQRTLAYINQKTFGYSKNLFPIRNTRFRVATVLACFFALGVCTWFLPAASIDLDINPSIQLQVNVLDRVIGLRGCNPDGEKAVQSMDVFGMPYRQAMQRILVSDALSPYLEKGNILSITVVGGIHSKELLDYAVCQAYGVAGEEKVFSCQTDKKTERAAREVGLSVPRYLAWQKMLQSDPEVSPQAAAQLPMEKIRELAQPEMRDDPCREEKNL